MNNRRHLLLLCSCQTSPSQATTPRPKFSRVLGFQWWKLAWQLGRLLGMTFHVRDPCKQTRMENDFVKEWCQNEICSMWRISSVGTSSPQSTFWVLTSRRGCFPSPGMGFMLSRMYSKDYGEEIRAGNKPFTLLGAGTSNSLLPSSYITPAAPGMSHRKGGYWMYTCDVAPEPLKTAPPCALVEACVLPISCNLKLDPETENFGIDYPLFLTCKCHHFSLSI